MWQQNIPDQPWDDTLFAAGGHFLQSSHWAAFQSALGRRVFYNQGEGWQCLAIVEESRTGRRLYCPYGPHVTTADALPHALDALKSLARQQLAVFARMEPTGLVGGLAKLGLKPALKDIQPHLTWVKNLNRPEAELLAEMSATNRNLHRTAANKGLTFEASHVPADMHVFLQMIHDVAQHTGMVPHPDSYFRTMATVLMPRGAMQQYIAKHNGQAVASALVFDSPTTRYYAHAGALLSARKLHPGTPLLTRMIFDAKANGQHWFDFYGVAPADQPNHRWAGFTKFKQSFGGEYKTYAGTWELPVHHIRYFLYRTAYVVKKTL